MPAEKRLVCIHCQAESLWGSLGRCPACGGVLRPVYGDAALATLARVGPARGLDRYRAVLPPGRPPPDLGEGNTPLVASRRLGPALGLRGLYLKLEGCNPSGSFKDRPASVALALALETGAQGVLTASSGNAGSAIAAYAAAVGLPCVILLEPGNPPPKLRQMLAYGARVVPVGGVFQRGPEAAARLVLDLAERLNYYPAFVWAPVNPYLLEGIKTVAYEVAAQLGEAPDVVVCPVGGGDTLTAVWRGFEDLRRAGVVERTPRMVGVQSEAAAPLVRAFEADACHVATLLEARSRVSGINVAFSGDHALAAVRASGGTAVAVPDESIFQAQARLAREEGLWVEPASAAPLAALAALVERGAVGPGERVVCLLTGAGFKDAGLAAEAAEQVSWMPAAPFDVEAIAARLGEDGGR